MAVKIGNEVRYAGMTVGEEYHSYTDDDYQWVILWDGEKETRSLVWATAFAFDHGPAEITPDLTPEAKATYEAFKAKEEAPAPRRRRYGYRRW